MRKFSVRVKSYAVSSRKKSDHVTIMFQIALALFCAVAASGVLGDPDADAAYRTYPEKIHKYGYTRSKLVLPYRRPWTYGGRNSPYGLHYTPDTYARRHYGFQKPAVRGLGVSRDFRDGKELCKIQRINWDKL